MNIVSDSNSVREKHTNPEMHCLIAICYWFQCKLSYLYSIIKYYYHMSN